MWASALVLVLFVFIDKMHSARALVPCAARCVGLVPAVKFSRSSGPRGAGGKVGFGAMVKQRMRRSSSLFMNFFAREAAKTKEEKDPGDVKGTKLKVLKYPHPLLREENAEVIDFNDELRSRAAQMLLVMYAADGIGLAAPQVGINQRLMVFNEAGEPDEIDSEMVLCNPVIVRQSEEFNWREEGCLSFPMIHGEVRRALQVDVEYQDLQGEQQAAFLTGFAARIFLHEFDHLDKVLFIDRFEPRDIKTNRKRLDKYIKKYGPGGAP